MASSIDHFTRSLWIDALSIGQLNTLERNHQVWQMGRIHEGAQRVIAWMGDDVDLATLLQPGLRYSGQDKRTHDCEPRHSIVIVRAGERYLNLASFCNNVYWKRAWVTQETLLVRKLYLVAQDCMISLETIRSLAPTIIGKDAEFWRPLGELLSRISKPKDQIWPRLIENLELYRGRGCYHARDRASSLVTVSQEGWRLRVDYGSSRIAVARDIMCASETDLCLRRASFVLESLEIDKGAADFELDVPFIQVEASDTVRHIAPCFRCSDDSTMASIKLPPRSKTRMRCVCLHCNHLTTLTPSLIHKNLHFGHLIMLWGALGKGNCFDWHLYWVPYGGGSWLMLETKKYVITTPEGAFQSLVLSVSLVLEIVALTQVV